MTPEFEWLNDKAYNAYSQWGEDGVLEAIFSTILVKNQWCLECGAADGLFFSNTRRLIEKGWRGVLIEADDAEFDRLVANNSRDGLGDRTTCVHGKIGKDHTLESVLQKVGAPIDIDLVVIDVDGQDFHLFNSLLKYRPRVVVVEYSMTEHIDFIPTIGGPGQAGQRALMKLGIGKLYMPVWESMTNVIFVHQSLCQLLARGAA